MRFIFHRYSFATRAFAAAVIGAAMAASGAAPSNSATIFQKLFGGGKADPPAAGAASTPLQVDPNDIIAPIYCPELHLSVGGEAYASFDRDHDGEAKYVRYLGSISNTARECHTVTDTGISLKIGIAGRVVAGPKGSAGKVTLPIKVTVVKQKTSKVLYTKTYTVTATLSGSDLSGDFSQVIDPISFKRTADDEDLILYVGFDNNFNNKPSTG